jgi:hypothetical protein
MVHRSRIDRLLHVDDATLRAAPSLRRGAGLEPAFTAEQYRAWLKQQPAGSDVHATPHPKRGEMELVAFMETTVARDAAYAPRPDPPSHPAHQRERS